MACKVYTYIYPIIVMNAAIVSDFDYLTERARMNGGHLVAENPVNNMFYFPMLPSYRDIISAFFIFDNYIGIPGLFSVSDINKTTYLILYIVQC